ncbi:CLIP-associating protein 1-like [Chiloscyllium plagiosum]|uniref:CLIP-associating protein 1-like n=1 Tax=Chiloscyllium plagiosum TaxID=36176 RepID=UPI001CB7AD76|nr:CLIP-associating protein 1-like [Chiloscyllium plagiosum]
MELSATPQYVWERMLGGFKHKNFRTREGICLCLISTLNAYGAHSLTLSKIVPHICNLLGDPNSQVRDAAINSLVEIYKHVGERVRADLHKKGLPQSRCLLSTQDPRRGSFRLKWRNRPTLVILSRHEVLYQWLLGIPGKVSSWLQMRLPGLLVA